jgi:hypothetical protein
MYMYDHASEHGVEPGEAALLGWVHDYGYMIGDNTDHADLGSHVLRDQGYVHWIEIRDHGTPAGLSTPLGRLLNEADMMIDSRGDEVGYDNRLMDIAERYGNDSPQYANASLMIALLTA